MSQRQKEPLRDVEPLQADDFLDSSQVEGVVKIEKRRLLQSNMTSNLAYSQSEQSQLRPKQREQQMAIEENEEQNYFNQEFGDVDEHYSGEIECDVAQEDDSCCPEIDNTFLSAAKSA